MWKVFPHQIITSSYISATSEFALFKQTEGPRNNQAMTKQFLICYYVFKLH